MAETTTLHTATVRIQYVQESVTKGGLRRFLIGAIRLDDAGDRLADKYLSFTTLDQFKAALCKQVEKTDTLLWVKFRETAWFDASLLHVELVKGAA